MTALTTIGGWATILAVAGGVYYISSRKEKTRRPPSSRQASKPAESKKEKTKKGKKAAIQSDGDSEVKSGAEKKQKTKKPAAPKAQSDPPTYAEVADDHEEEEDNREFARQMAAAKSGAIVAPKSKTEARAKSVKQNKAQEKQSIELSSDNFTAPSSANGGDADDDESPTNSPELSATTLESPVSGGVEDMLEKPAPGPSVLKIAAPTNPVPTKKKTQAAPAPAETKKQRQNRQKAEAKKLEREQEEAERQKLMEQTRRNARIAEGRAAKDGSAFLASKTPTTSSWAAPLPTVNGTTTSNQKVELLDTTEPPPKKQEPVHSASEEHGTKWATNLSEEEQIRLITENENWETVKKDKKKRPQKEATESSKGEKKVEESSADEAKEYAVPPKIAPTGPGQKWSAKLTHVDENKNVVEREVELEDDEWEVS